MTRVLKALPLIAAFAAGCVPAAANDISGEWHLVAMNGLRAEVPVAITFADDGKVQGNGPCNRFFGTYSGPLPDLTLSPFGKTKMACPQMELEFIYLGTLQASVRAEVIGDRLLMSGLQGVMMEFSRDPQDETCHTCREDQQP
jgi:heat shock protein HslJ